jgi:Protein of unknown function (DUF3551)
MRHRLSAPKLLRPLPLIALSLFTAYAATGTAAKAQQKAPDYPWCANYTKGSISCSFVTYEQCMADVSGIGGFCERNPLSHPTAAPAHPKPRASSGAN